VGLVEPEVDETRPVKSNPHTMAVASVIASPIYGLAPGAMPVFYNAGKTGGPDLISAEPGFWDDKYIAPLSDNPVDLQQRLETSCCYDYNELSKTLQKILVNRDPALRILNMSIGTSRAALYSNLASCLNESDDSGNYKYPQLRAMIMGPYAASHDINEEMYLQACIRYVDRILENSPQVRLSNQNYQNTTRALAQNGIFVVVAAGNEHSQLPLDIAVKSSSDFNDFAKSPYVISVAASDTQGTPGYQADDTLADFSSWGSNSGWSPTLAAPGSGIQVPRWLFPNGVVDGTSFSAPYVSATLAMMLQRNPNLSFFQGKTLLQNACVHVPLPPQATGAGMLNPVAAVMLTPPAPTVPL
jgi:subtilisin family serine protease